MNTFRRFGILGFFAVVGVGFAIMVGMQAVPADVQESSRHEKNISSTNISAESAAVKDSGNSDSGKKNAIDKNKDSATKPTIVQAEAVVTIPPPPQNEPVKPIIVQPYPIKSQQYIPPPPSEKPAANESSGIMQFLKDRLTTPLPTIEKPSRAASNQTVKTQKKSNIESEGDGKLRIHIYDENIRTVLDMLSEVGNMNILSSKSVEGKVSATLNGVDIDSALDAILKSTGFVAKRDGNYVFVGTPDDFNTLEQSMDKIGTKVYQPNYIAAADLKTLITPLLSDKVGIISISTPSEAGIASSDSNAGSNKLAGPEVVVVRDYEAVLAQIDQMIDEVDVRPMQVSIESMILSVKLKDNDKFGVNFEFLRDKPNLKFGIGTPPESLANLKFEDGGLKFGFLDQSLGTFINALETIGDTNVIANPRVMVMNKQRAEIQIGEQKGYLSSTVTQTSTTYAVQFLDLGAQLRLRPFISSDGMVRLEIHPELSDGDVKLEGGYTLPNKTVTQVTTNVMVRDGRTVIIGGLMRDQLVTNTTQVPFFGSLPIVGVAFRNTDETIERHEVLVLITPRIIYEPGIGAEGEKAAAEYCRRHSIYADKMNPLGKRSIARRYFRLAQSAWADGDQKKALRFAEMAVQFDPVNRAAIDLRSDIWLGKRTGEHTLGAEQAGYNCPGQNPLDGAAMADWLIEDLENPHIEEPIPLHPYDRGQSGQRQDISRPTQLQTK